jgi:hypothetical protein
VVLLQPPEKSLPKERAAERGREEVLVKGIHTKYQYSLVTPYIILTILLPGWSL